MRPVLLVIALLATLSTACAQGRSGPGHIVSQAAGGTPDIICRLLERLSSAIGQPVVVENRPGGGNVIGAQAAARATPDGHSFFVAATAALVTNPRTFKTLPYDPVRDFVPVSMVGKAPFFVAARRLRSRGRRSRQDRGGNAARILGLPENARAP
jgi:tripartite-type tricarboxylate transporter receptor subunit TctC